MIPLRTIAGITPTRSAAAVHWGSVAAYVSGGALVAVRSGICLARIPLQEETPDELARALNWVQTAIERALQMPWAQRCSVCGLAEPVGEHRCQNTKGEK